MAETLTQILTGKLELKTREWQEIYKKALAENDDTKVHSMFEDLNRLQKEMDDLGEKRDNAIQIDSKASTNVVTLTTPEGKSAQIPISGGQVSGQRHGASEIMTIGEAYVAGAQYKAFDWNKLKADAHRIEQKDLFHIQGSSPSYVPDNRRSNLIVPYPVREAVMDTLIPQIPINQNAAIWLEETVRTSGAGSVTENDPRKRQSTLTFEEKQMAVRDLRVSIEVTKHAMRDAGQVIGLINNRLMSMLNLQKDHDVLHADGNSPNILGLLNVPNIGSYTRDTVGGETVLDALYLAKTDVKLESKLTPNALVLHPSDLARIRLTRANGLYVFGSPAEPGITRLWGMSVVENEDMTEHTGFLGAFDLGAIQFIMDGITITASTENEDNFYRGIISIKAEMSLVLATMRPQAFSTVESI